MNIQNLFANQTAILFVLYGLLFLLIMFILLREGMQEAYMHGNHSAEKRARLSKQWHTIGFWLRLMVIVLVYMVNFNLCAAATAIILLGPGYNITINIYRGHAWYYVGKVAATDKLIRKLFWFVDFDKALKK
ncbi:MAG: hypothetical protein PHG67_06095 [Bacteroidales bacterium]|jgi:ABC-type Fe3+ transport system permease subunit|nr:hypothetical protein [Bacteroidales bacterium]HOI31211.1 hypothetical protein [Bacteroidales bacterium]